MKKVCLQAGHQGSTGGAPGERQWNVETVSTVAQLLKDKVEVYKCGSFAYEDKTVTETDWDLFLAVHYDADIYNDRGGFTDYPEPSTDYATKRSQALSKAIKQYYFPETGIPFKSRSNANTRYYYMWKYLTADTPCVIIECGVGWRKPEDYTVLREPSTPQILANSILSALGLEENDMEEDCIDSFDVNADIPTEIEKKFDPPLKSYEWYDKHWSFQRLVNFADTTYQTSERQGKDIATLNKKLVECKKEVEDIRDKSQIALTNCNNENIKLKAKNVELLEALKECRTGNAALCDYPSLERFKSLFTCPKGGE